MMNPMNQLLEPHDAMVGYALRIRQGMSSLALLAQADDETRRAVLEVTQVRGGCSWGAMNGEFIMAQKKLNKLGYIYIYIIFNYIYICVHIIYVSSYT